MLLTRFKALCGVLLACNILGGCGSQIGPAAAGVAGGAAASHTMQGIKADLEARENKLVADYRQALETGARADQLRQLENRIADVNQVRQTIPVIGDAVASGLDPTKTGAAVASLGALAWGLWQRRSVQHYRTAVTRYMSKTDAAESEKLLNEVARTAAKVGT